MNPKGIYHVMQERIEVRGGEQWSKHVHLYREYQDGTVYLYEALCGAKSRGDARKFRRFGERKDFGTIGRLNAGIYICAGCERARLEEPEAVLYCVVHEKRGMLDGKETWVKQENEYFHATGEEDAKRNLQVLFPSSGPLVRVVACGPAIGFQVEEEKKDGLILRAQ